ncbi:hypothetical protein MANES_11G149800v8 [Manihot esculenta]|uniref:Uncharacterized protein n=1 Tax=Manihot esculenta TaxID=3983 RepID=A0ACB7GWX6_MANES|nr:hypothetical protein MANES_11G149800v8 [Manihot esculenta]
MHSDGIFEHPKSPEKFLTYALPLLELQLTLIIFTTNVLYFILKRIGITMFICQVLTGIILGPTLFGRLEFMRRVVFPLESQPFLTSVGLLGFSIHIFLNAVKLDLGVVVRSGKIAMISGALSVITPIVCGMGVLIPYKEHLLDKRSFTSASTVVFLNCYSTFSFIVRVLEELKLVNSELSYIALSSSLTSDVVGMGVVFFSTIARQKMSIREVMTDVSGMVGFWIAGIFIFRQLVMREIRKTLPGLPLNSSFIYLILALMAASQVYYVFFINIQCLGAFIFGLLIPAGPPLGSALVDKLESFTIGILLPITVSAGVMRADLTLIFTEFAKAEFYIAIIFLCFGSKLVGCLIPSLCWKIPLIDSVIFAVIMTSRGLIEIIIYTLAIDFMLIEEVVFSTLILCLLMNAIFVAIVVKNLYDPSRKYAGYRARNIMSLKPNSELRIMACIHKPENVTTITRLLDAFHPHKDRPIGIHILHLIELAGRASPLRICHLKQKPVSESCSHNVIFAFNQYEQNNWDSVSIISTYTTISPINLMNEDISILALEKLASLILLPLHKRWNIHGDIEAEDQNLRAVNIKVLEKAPCSVGIFYDRGKLGRLSPPVGSQARIFSICMIFLGGKDDFEALSLSRRIAKHSNTCLTVISFLPEDDRLIHYEERKLNSLVLEDIKENSGFRSNITYKELVVKDGPQTALIIHSIMNNYDLFIIGRRWGIESPQTAGLSDWTELPELGIIGDLLASKDVQTKAAVLVVQQQKHMK